MNKRMNRNRLNIGAYILQPYARTEQHIKDLAESGVEFVVCMGNDRPALDLFSKYGVGAIVTGVLPGWWGGDGNNAGKLEETNPIEKYIAAAEAFEDHPAVWGIDVGDEPSALDFPYYGKVIDLVNRKFPNQFAYLNLYPNYASVAKNNAAETVNQLGTATYAEHIAEYCKNIPSDYICYDFYPYSCNVTKHYENLCIVADAARNTGRSMWIVLQVNSNKPQEKTSVNRMRFQAYSSMAFGAENIIWACYTGGWWEHNILDKEGNKTEQYDKMKQFNAELRTVADEYMKYRRVATHFVGFAGHPDMAAVQQAPIDALSTGVFFDVKAEGTPLVVGEMVSRTADGSNALFICAADDPRDEGGKVSTITFRSDREITAIGGHGPIEVKKCCCGCWSIELASNEGALVVAK